MNSTLNEYVHESFRVTTRSGKIKVFYEPIDYTALHIEALVYRQGTKINEFFNSQQDLVFRPILRENVINDPMPLKGFFTLNRHIVLIWNKDPQEHFLCVSYIHQDIEDKFSNNKNNWCLEGF
jgi:hypothetical protein